jgi:hypothetical protein
MELRNVAVFGTRHILAESPLFAGQEPVYQEYFRGELLAWYSTGKLEEALAQGMEVYVVSIRPVFGQQDVWWQDLVAPDRVFNATGIFAAAVNGDPLEASFVPWRSLYGLLGIPWPEGRFRDFDDPAVWLASQHGVKDGSLFAGHHLLC